MHSPRKLSAEGHRGSVTCTALCVEKENVVSIKKGEKKRGKAQSAAQHIGLSTRATPKGLKQPRKPKEVPQDGSRASPVMNFHSCTFIIIVPLSPLALQHIIPVIEAAARTVLFPQHSSWKCDGLSLRAGVCMAVTPGVMLCFPPFSLAPSDCPQKSQVCHSAQQSLAFGSFLSF